MIRKLLAGACIASLLATSVFAQGFNPAPVGGGGSTSPGGTSGQVQVNNSGSFGGVAVTGSGNVVEATSPTLVTPNIGTPSAANLANATGYPLATTGAAGIVKPDGTSITITAGVISAASGGTGCTVSGTANQAVSNNGSTGCQSDATTISTAGRVVTPAATTTQAMLNLPHGAAPTSPVNGDVWTTTAGIYVRINGATVGPLSVGAGAAPRYVLLGKLIGADCNSTADQAITLTQPSTGPWGIAAIMAVHPSISLSTVKGTFYAATGKTSQVFPGMSATSAWSGLTGGTQSAGSSASGITSTSGYTSTTATTNDGYLSAATTTATIYWSATTAQGATCTFDIYAFGWDFT